MTDTLVEQLPGFVLSALQVGLCLIALFILSPVLGVIGSGTVLIFFRGYASYRRRYQESNRATIEAQADYFKTLGGQLSQGLLIRINDWGRAALSRFILSGREFVSRSLHLLNIDFAISNIGSLIARAASISFVLAFGLTGPRAISIASVVSGLMLLDVLVTGCQGTLSRGKSMARFAVAEKRLEALRQLSTEPLGQLEVDHVDTIVLDDVSFGFSSVPLFSKISLDLRLGVHCVSGPNGTGKSTLLHLIAGVYEPTSGAIRVNDACLSSVNMEKFRGWSLGYVEQSSYLFQGTVYGNLIFGNLREDVSEDVEFLLGNVLDFVPRLPDGMDTDVGVDGKCLSGGQRQHISIARAVLKRPRVLLLDEPTSALDARGRKALIELLEVLRDDTIVIIVTHERELLERFETLVTLH